VPLQCLHLTFAQGMQGRMLRAAGGNQLDVSFLQNVHALQGTVSNWHDALDLHQLSALSPGQSIITADQLRIYSTGDLNANQPPGAPRLVSTPQASGFWELEANGNVTAESIPSQGRIKVMAQRAQYVLHQDRLRIEGMPQRPAVIWMTDPKLPAGAPAEFQVRFAEVNVRTLEYGAMELVSASVLLLPECPRQEPGGHLLLPDLQPVRTCQRDLFLDRVPEIYPIRANCFQEDQGAVRRSQIARSAHSHLPAPSDLAS
jgi:hypothetical protein